MGEFASKGMAGTALGFGIGGTALALMNNGNNCGGGILGNLFGGNNNCHVSKDELAFALLNQEKMAGKDAEIARLSAAQSTDGKLLELYRFNEEQFAKRDTVTTGALIEIGKESVRNENARAEILELKLEQKAQKEEICQLKADLGVVSERVTALAVNTKQVIEAQGKEFYAALGQEAERRECADNALRCYVDATFVPGKIVMPLDAICPEAMPRCETAGAVRVQTVK